MKKTIIKKKVAPIVEERQYLVQITQQSGKPHKVYSVFKVAILADGEKFNNILKSLGLPATKL
jgi:hypothetical protein